MADVARVSAVSASTVSLYLRKPRAVSAKAGRQIARAIDELGYVPNLVAGGLASATSRVVGVVVPSVRNAFFAETVSTLQRLLSTAGLQALVGHAEYSDEQEEALVRIALAWSPAGIVLTGLRHSETTRQLLKSTVTPVVEMWELGAEPIDMNVGFSHHAVGAAAARHVLARGRSKPAFLGARLHEDGRAAQRAEGFVAEATRQQVGAPVIAHAGPASTEAGAILLDRALAAVSDVDALVCSNDTVALGVLFECQRRGIKVPTDLAVIGFGDLEFSGFSVPPLTTIRPSGNLIAREVARLLLRRIENKHQLGARSVTDTGFSLIQREST